MKLEQMQIVHALQRALAGGDIRMFDVTTRHLQKQQALLLKAQQLKGVQMLLDNWDVLYPADAIPEESSPVWTATTVGSPTYATAASVLTLDAPTTSGGAYFSWGAPELEPTDRVIVDAKLYIPSSSALPNRGAQISIFNGLYQYTVWFRATELNVDGVDPVRCTFDRFRRIRVVAAETGCAVWVDGGLRQAGLYMNSTEEKKICFGSYID